MMSFSQHGYQHSLWAAPKPQEVPTRDQTPPYLLIGGTNKTLIFRRKNLFDVLPDSELETLGRSYKYLESKAERLNEYLNDFTKAMRQI